MTQKTGLVADAGEISIAARGPRRFSRGRVLAAVILVASIAGLTAFALYPVKSVSGFQTSENNPCNCHPYGPDSLLTVTGIPTAYVPDMTYTITISVDDLNGLALNNSFVMDVTGGGTMNASMQTDPNIEINTVNQRASVNDTKAPMHASSWQVVWKAPASGDVTFNVTAVSANDGASGGDSPKDSDQVTISATAIPEFSALLVPMLAVVGLIVVMKLGVRR